MQALSILRQQHPNVILKSLTRGVLHYVVSHCHDFRKIMDGIKCIIQRILTAICFYEGEEVLSLPVVAHEVFKLVEGHFTILGIYRLHKFLTATVISLKTLQSKGNK